MALECLVSISCPGTSYELRDNANLWSLMMLLEEAGIDYKIADTMAGWGCLNQDWLEFCCEVETSWDWCYPTFIGPSAWQHRWYPLLREGRLLMQVHYKKGDELVSHH